MEASFTGIILFTVALFTACAATCPDINVWSGRNPKSVQTATRPTSTVVIRGGQGQRCFSRFNCQKAISELQNIDMQQNGLPDIDCSVVVGGDGYAYSGRGWDIQTSTYSDSVVICVLENTDAGQYPDKYQAETINDLLTCAVEKKMITSDYTVATPRDYDASSKDPTTLLYTWVKGLANYKVPSSNVIG